jgi:hypothetical protein
MFNTVCRKIAGEELVQCFPELVHMFDALYPVTGSRVWYQASDGSIQYITQLDGFAQGDRS